MRMIIRFVSKDVGNTTYVNFDNVIDFYFDNDNNLVYKGNSGIQEVIGFKDKAYRDNAIKRIGEVINGKLGWWDIDTGL
jgi:hypothetical protein